MEQLNHPQITQTKQTFPVVVVGDELRTPQNVGMCLRTAEAFGVSTFYLSSTSPDINNRIVKRTARSTENHLKTITYQNQNSLLKTLKSEGYFLIALEVTNSSKPIEQYSFTKHDKIAILIGSERFGIQKEALQLCEESIHISMHGKNSSMNVVNSLSIGLYELTKQFTQTYKTLKI